MLSLFFIILNIGFIIIEIIDLVRYFKKPHTNRTLNNLAIMFSSFSLCGYILSTALLANCIASGYRQKDYSAKAEIEHCLTVCDDDFFEYELGRAKKYNAYVDKYNTLGYRFSIEDRSQYKIDIKYYLNLRDIHDFEEIDYRAVNIEEFR